MNFTDVTPVNVVPVTVTLMPTTPPVGVKLLIAGVIVKFPVLVPVPVGVVTLMRPVVAPAGAVAVILIAVLTVKVAEVPLNVTDVAPVKFVPLMITLVLTGPRAGEKLLTRGATVKLLELVAVPADVVTLIGPVVALAGTVALIWVLRLPLKAAEVPLNLTAVVPVKFAPVMVTLAPTAPLGGATLVIRGATVNLLALVAVPSGVVTLMSPVVAPVGTVAVILIGVLAVKMVEMPLNVTLVAPVKFVPLIVTLAPTGPPVGAKLPSAGVAPPTACTRSPLLEANRVSES